MTIVKHIHWLLYPLFFLACARQTTPTGGPKDSIPPTLLSSVPKQGQINFKGKAIALTFSEDVTLNDPREQIIITPDIGTAPDVKSKKNQVIIQLENELADSTTYTINFRESIQDITEKNPAQRLKLAFSTGGYVDSLSIEGTIYDLLTDKEIEDGTVALYATDTFDIFKHRPSYFTKSDEKGLFRLENLKPGTYFIYGMQDKNNNLVVDSRTESYGFLKTPVKLTTNQKDIKIPLVRLDSRPLKLTSARPFGTYFNIKTNKSMNSYFATPVTGDESIISSFGEDHANIRIYNTFQSTDSLLIQFIAEDSVQNSIDTTFFVKFAEREIKPEVFGLTTNSFQIISAKGILRGQIEFTKPISTINFDSIYYSLDSANRISFSAENLKWDSLNNILFIDKTFDKTILPQDASNERPLNTGLDPTKRTSKTTSKSSIKNQLYVGYATFISVELDSSKRTIEKITPSKFEETGVLLTEISTQAPSYFCELLSKDFKVLHKTVGKRKFSFEDLSPGDYQIRLVIDRNNNGKWDPGNFYIREEPEEIKYYKNEKDVSIVNLKANWEIGPLLIKH